MGIGDWGMEIDPIPNKQSPIPNPHFIYLSITNYFIYEENSK